MRTGIRGRRPKALSDSMASMSSMSDDVPLIPPPSSVAKDVKPTIGVPSVGLKRLY